MLKCPKCQTALTRTKSEAGLIWRCSTCGGLALLISILRKIVSTEAINRFWRRSREKSLPQVLACPGCNNRMEEVLFETPRGDRTLDVCETCQFVWIDKDEWSDLPVKEPAKKDRDTLLPEAREQLAIHKIDLQRKRHEATYSNDSAAEDITWQSIPAEFGLPQEEEAPNVVQSAPIVWLTAFLVLCGGLAGLLQPNWVETFGLVPSEWTPSQATPLATSFFLQPNYFTLTINIYFLLVFGDNVEQLIGGIRTAALLAFSTLTAAICHLCFSPESTLTYIGAGGGVSGIVAFYILSFPKARLSMILSYRHRFLPIRYREKIGISPLFLGAIWVLYNWFFSEFSGKGIGGVSTSGQLAGLLCGFIFWKILPKSMTPHRK